MAPASLVTIRRRMRYVFAAARSLHREREQIMTQLTDNQRLVLRALTDTVVPAIARDNDPAGFWATPGTATGAHELIAWWLENAAPPAISAGLGMLLNGLAQLGFATAAPQGREAQLPGVAAFGPDAELGIGVLITQAVLFSYPATDADANSPLWPGTGYPGPLA